MKNYHPHARVPRHGYALCQTLPAGVRFVVCFSLLFISLLLPPAATNAAQDNIPEYIEMQRVPDTTAAEPEAPANEIDETLQMLDRIQESIARQQNKIRGLRLEMRLASTEEEKESIQQKINELQKDIEDDLESFHNLAAGESLSVFATEAKKDFKFNEQLETILAPLMRELAELTERPRDIDTLRTTIQFKKEQIPAVEKHIDRIDTFIEKTQDLELRQQLQELRTEWAEVKATLENDLQLARYKLDQIMKENTSFSTTLGKTLESFFKTRGKNLLLAICTFFAVFFLMRWLKTMLFSMPYLKKLEKQSFGLRLFNLSFVFLVVISASSAALGLLYAAGDWLLLVVFFVLFLSIAWSAKEGFMQYWEEIKLVLNIGSVREGERIVYRNIPWRVQRLNYYTKLENPEISGGAIRIRLRDLIDYVTRPYAPDEPWFPTRKGDWVILDDGTYGKVVQQSVDMVRLWLYGESFKTYQTQSFLGLNPKVLSTGFLVKSVFGVDYSHQDIATTEIPKTFEQAIRNALEKAGKTDVLQSLTVDFSQAGASSLDIVIFATFHGSAADSYFGMGRIIQRACVDTCTHKGWIIPFPQLTVHSQGKED